MILFHKMTFPASFKGVLCQEACQGVPCCVSLVGSMTTLTHTFKKEARKLLISLEAKNLRFDITQVTSTLIGYVELLGFHENWLECSSDIIAQKCIKL